MFFHFHNYSNAKFECHGCWLFIVLWRVGEHQFSSAKCPRSFHCGEHFPSSPFSQATIATKPTSSCFAATKKTDIRGAIVVKSFTSSQENDVENYKSACHSLYMKLLITKNYQFSCSFKVSHTVIKNCLEKSLTFLSSVIIFGVKIQTLAITNFLSFYFIKLKI